MPHTHDGFAVGVIDAGAERYRYRGAERLAPAGSVVVIAPGEVHTGRAGSETGWVYHMAYPASSWVEQAYRSVGGRGLPRFPGGPLEHPPLAAASGGPPGAGGWPGRAAGRPGPRPHAERPGRARRPDPHLPVAQLSYAPGPAAARLYLLGVRVALARRPLFAQPPPAEVAMLAGFCDQPHLNRVFKRVLGVTPGAFQRVQTGRNVQDPARRERYPEAMTVPRLLPGPLPSRARFRAGFTAMLPIWLGVAPFAVAYAVTARAAGLSLPETQFMSLTVFAGASQFAAAGLFGQGVGAASIIATTFLLNVRHVLYGLSLAQGLPVHGWRRLLAAQFLTDEAYGVTIAAHGGNTAAGPKQPGGLSLAFLLGAELSLYAVWNLFTLLGSLAGSVIPDPKAVGADVVFPLAFLGLLVPLLRGRLEVLVAVFAGLLAWGVSRLFPGGVTVLVAGVGGALLGALLSTRSRSAEPS